MSTGKEAKFSLKAMINKQKTKVLFVEADSHFTDVLLSFLTLPLGTIIKTLKNHYGNEAPVIGSLTSLYNGIENMDSIHFWGGPGKEFVLSPTNTSELERCRLKLDVSYDAAPEYLRWVDENNKRKRWTMGHQDLEADQAAGDGDDDGVYTISSASFIISDDLCIAPAVPGSILQTLDDLQITDADYAELRMVTFGLNEIVDLLKGSLLSTTPLTDLILHNNKKMDVTVRTDLVHKVVKEPSSNSKKMVMKAMVQKSTNKILSGVAEEKLIDFFCSCLTIPLGGIECLLGSKTPIKNIDNLYESVANFIGDRYLKSSNIKDLLVRPKLPSFYISKNQILSFIEEDLSDSIPMSDGHKLTLSTHFPNGTGSYVKGPAMYSITDDLTVTPFHLSSSLSILTELQIPLSDVKEVELHIGFEEALSILKASLVSTSALTWGLTKNISDKQPDQQKYSGLI